MTSTVAGDPSASRKLVGGANPFLASVGAILIASALVGYFLELSAEMGSLLAFLGVIVSVMAAFEPRMEGLLELSPSKFKTNLARFEEVATAAAVAVTSAERELLDKAVWSLPGSTALPERGGVFILLARRARQRLDATPADVRRRLVRRLREQLEDEDPSQPDYRRVPLDDEFEALVRPLSPEEVTRSGRPDSELAYVVADVSVQAVIKPR